MVAVAGVESMAMMLKELRDKVADNGDVLTVTMDVVRDAYGAERLGSNVRADIEDELRRLGVEHQPSKLPRYQEDEVRLYIKGSKVASLKRACRFVGKRWDDRLREAANSDAVETLDKIRDMLNGGK